MRQSFLPNTDSGLLAWGRTFDSVLQTGPESFGVSPALADEFSAALLGYAEAMKAVDPGERCRAAVVTKNGERARLKDVARRIASIVHGQADVPDAQKLELGLRVRALRGTSIARPSLPPRVQIRSMNGHKMRLRLYDKEAIHRGRPPNVRGACVFWFAGEHPPTKIQDWHFATCTSKTKVEIRFPADIAPGTPVWTTAFWVNGKMEAGPASDGVGDYIQFRGPIRLAA